MKMTFGGYLKQLRKEKQITLKELADEMNISLSYLSDVEKERRDSFDLEKLEIIIKYLSLNDVQANTLMNLAGDQRHEIAPDLPDYINGKNYIHTALRRAKDLNAGEEEWLEFIKFLEEKDGFNNK